MVPLVSAGESAFAFSGPETGWHAIRFTAAGDLTVFMQVTGEEFAAEYALYDESNEPLAATWLGKIISGSVVQAEVQDGTFHPININPEGHGSAETGRSFGRYALPESSFFTAVVFAAGWPTAWQATFTSSHGVAILSETSGKETFFVKPSNFTFETRVRAEILQTGAAYQQNASYSFASPGILVGDIYFDKWASTGSFRLEGPTTFNCACFLSSIAGSRAATPGNYVLRRDGMEVHDISPPYLMGAASVRLPP